MKLIDWLTVDRIKELSLPSNFRYGEAVYRRGAVEMIAQTETRVEPWVRRS